MHDGVACAQRDKVLLRGVGDEEAATVVAAVLAERDDHRHERLLVAVDAVATALARSVPPYQRPARPARALGAVRRSTVVATALLREALLNVRREASCRRTQHVSYFCRYGAPLGGGFGRIPLRHEVELLRRLRGGRVRWGWG